MSEVKGKQSLRFAKTPFILNSASVVGKKEGEGPLGEYFDVIGNDDKFGCESWEEAESTLQKEAATLALGKSGLTPEEIRYILQETCWVRLLQHPLDFSTLKFLCLVCMEPALRQGNPCHLEQCAWRQDLRKMS